jgi:outer membrane protein assembly factor BamD (BamD/ComL family)
MRTPHHTWRTVLFLILFLVGSPAFSQLGIDFEIEKPEEYEDRVLRSERSNEKKFTVPRRLIQNTVTHYNYYFNANNKLNEVLERAKTAYTDDFSKLLSFYNYSLDVTARDSIQLDSITYKASTGIALHDLRNDWVDNLYLLWGASYYLRKEFDSAYLMFQFINYAFAPKEKDGYYITIGSNRDGNTANSISTKEKNSLPRRVFSEPPSRNDAFIWQIRNFLAQNQLAEAASLIVTLRTDPLFPKRLQDDLHEVQSYWFYKQQMWDSSAAHLVEALDNATSLQEKARWEFLAAQMFEMAENFKEAEKYYSRVSTHTTNPIMDIYARLYSIRVNKDEGERTIEKNVAELLRMAKRDKYDGYEDIIYFMAAQMQLQGNNVEAAMDLLKKSTEFLANNPSQRNKTFLQLAELSYSRKQYRQAYNFYDSLNLGDPSITNLVELTARKDMLGRLADATETIAREDSLQRIAAMPEEERTDYLKKLVREIRRKQGLKDYPGVTVNPINVSNPNLFPNETRGEWYFYNDNSKARGLNEFKGKWGNRPNVDNWRRSALLTGLNPGANNTNPGNVKTQPGKGQGVSGADIDFEKLSADLPLTPEQLQVSNDSLQSALFTAGKIYMQEIEDCEQGIRTLEELRTRFPGFQKMDEVLFNLYYCYRKSGNQQQAQAMANLLSDKYPTSNFTSIVQSGKNPQISVKEEATKTYERIYDLFIEGSFEEAVAEKKKADAKYGRNYWTPQLLYIEAVFYIRQRDDETAKSVLNSIINGFPDSPLKPRAATLLDVLSRRAKIEEELRNMVVTRNEDSTVASKPIVTKLPPVKKDTTGTVTPPVVTIQPKPIVSDTTTKLPTPVVSQPKTPGAYSHDANAPHFVVLVLNRVDPVFINEAKNAFARYNRDTYYNKTYNLELVQLDNENRFLLISPFANAQDAVAYVDKAKPKTPTEILPWLRGGKYSFLILTQSNFDILKETKDIEKYRQFLEQQIPGKF